MITADEHIIEEQFAGKNVLFITTKKQDYIRNTQEIQLLRAAAKSVRVLASGRDSYVGRILAIFARLLFMSLRDYDAVFAGFAPQLIVPFFHWRFKKKFLAVDFFISVYDTLVFDRKKLREHALPARFARSLDRRTLRCARLILADTKAHAAYFVNSLGAEPAKIRILYLKADESIYFPRKVRGEHRKKNSLTVLYFGSILPLQGVDTILACVSQMKSRGNIRFDLIGPVNEAMRSSCEGRNVRFTPWLPQSVLALRIAAADLCLAGHFNAGIEKASRTIPGKAFIYEAMCKPMILGDNPANRELFLEDGMHFFVKMGDPQALANTILKAAAALGFRLGN